jgi:predicted AlkP superfamily pyrophosphatase or phosphodiesterase
MRKRYWIYELPLILLLPLFLGAPTAAVSPQPPRNFFRPKLIVMMVIDQFRYDYLVRFRPEFVAKGFNLLLSGADFVDCRYHYASTFTCPGHATLFAGAYPTNTGIIDNEWYDPALHRSEYCVEDLGAKLVGAQDGPGMSPRNLIGSTIGDELRSATDFKSKVIAISMKDRASVIPGGHLANAAYWYDAKSGNFVTSTYYLPSLPDWVQEFNSQKISAARCGKNWVALPQTPGVQGGMLREFKSQSSETCPDARFRSWLEFTPFMNEVELKFALAAIKSEKLGQGNGTDLLTISLSANDYIGHIYGPYSPQVADATLRTDRYLAAFFEALDHTVGLANTWITLSADHGVAPNPGFIKEHHLGLGNFNPANVRSEVEQAMNQAFGPDQWVEHSDAIYVYLNHATMARRRVDLAQAQAVAASAAASVEGVKAAFTRTQIMSGALPRSPLAKAVSNSFNPLRSGDVFIVLEPYAVPVSGDTHTTHGSPWSYDTQVPLIFWGDAFNPGVYRTPAQPVDLAATIAAALGITETSGEQGRPLTVALKPVR